MMKRKNTELTSKVRARLNDGNFFPATKEGLLRALNPDCRLALSDICQWFDYVIEDA